MMDDGQDYSQLTLKEILENQDLVLQEILAITGIHTKIKINMKIFVEYCVSHPSFTEKFINMGLKCPMHQSNNSQMKQFTYIAADVLTSDHQTLADLFVLKTNTKEQTQQEEIQQQIQTDQVTGMQQQMKYKYLTSLFEYLNTQDLDENCVNYIAKTLATLVRKKISEYLQFFSQYPQYLNRLVQIAHYPSVAHLLAKMLTDDDDNLTDKAQSIKQKIIPLLLSKIHKQIGKPQILDVFEGMQDILSATRYSDNEQRSALQKMSDIIVSQKQVLFYVNTFFECLQKQKRTIDSFYCLQNSISFIGILVNRINMDQQHDFSYNQGNQEFTPTLHYQFQGLFQQFCHIISVFHKIWEYKDVVGNLFGIVTIKTIEPLMTMTKFSKFSSFYCKIDVKERTSALQALLHQLCTFNLNGVLLQSTSSLLQKMLTQEQKIAETQNEIACPGELYLSIAKYSGAIGGSIVVLLQESRKQRNMNQKGIYFRKILLLLDNYFQHSAVLKRYPDTAKLQKLFPSFTTHNNSLYAQKTIVLDHPGGEKVQPVEEFKFIQVNRINMRNNSPQLETYPVLSQVQEKVQKIEVVEVEVEEPKKGFTLNVDRIKSFKDKRQKDTDKDQNEVSTPANHSSPTNPTNQVSPTNDPLLPTQNPHPKQSNSQSQSPRSPNRQKQKDSTRLLSPCKPKQQTGLTFFIRHLMIY